VLCLHIQIFIPLFAAMKRAREYTTRRTYLVTSIEEPFQTWYIASGPSSAMRLMHKYLTAFYEEEQASEVPNTLTAWCLDEISKKDGPVWSRLICSEEARVMCLYQRIIKACGHQIHWEIRTADNLSKVQLGRVTVIVGFH
jgi:hypothetical protein